jgi:hypothetical protein
LTVFSRGRYHHFENISIKFTANISVKTDKEGERMQESLVKTHKNRTAISAL